MRKFLMISSVLCLLIGLSAPVYSTEQFKIHNGLEYVDNEVIVELEKSQEFKSMSARTNLGTSIQTQAEIIVGKTSNIEIKEIYPNITQYADNIIFSLRSKNKSALELKSEIEKQPGVKKVYFNYIYRLPKTETKIVNKSDFEKTDVTLASPNDPMYSQLWGMKKIEVDKVWGDHNFTGNGNVVVAVIDSGIDYNHEDLQANMSSKRGKRFYNNGQTSDDPMDIDSHGTHVAGTIGAVGNNGKGVVGVAWNVKLLAVNVFSQMQGGIGAIGSDIIKGIEYILAEKTNGLNIKVANMSIGGWASSPNLDYFNFIKAMGTAGIMTVVAAGNESQNISSPGVDPDTGRNHDGQLPYPASFKDNSIITVGATNTIDGKASYSNYSSAYVQVAAPGGDSNGLIMSTIPGNQYGGKGGTSMASPHVAGLVALLYMQYPNDTILQMRNRILNNAIETNSSYWANGRINALKSFLPTIVTGVELNKKTLIVAKEDTYQLIATVLPESVANKAVTWKSSNSDVAKVGGDGLVTGLAIGNATITVTTVDQGKTDTCVVTVRNDPIPVTNIQLTTTVLTLSVGNERELEYTIIPDNASVKTVLWKTSDSSVVSVSQSGAIRAESVGDATITVASTLYPTISADCYITVEGIVPVTSVRLTPSVINFTDIGDSQLLQLTILPTNATIDDIVWDTVNDYGSFVFNKDIGMVYPSSFQNGTGSIMVTVNGNKSSTCIVNTYIVQKNDAPVLKGEHPDNVKPAEAVRETDPLVVLQTIDTGKHNFDANSFIEDWWGLIVNDTILETVLTQTMQDITNWTRLPVFSALVPPGGKNGDVLALQVFDNLVYNTDEEEQKNPSYYKFIKISGKDKGHIFTYVNKASDYSDGKYTILDANDDIATGIASGHLYKMIIFIKDGGGNDLDGKEDGIVIDPGILAGGQSKHNDDDDSNWYGCSVAPSISIGLPFLAFLLYTNLRKKKNK